MPYLLRLDPAAQGENRGQLLRYILRQQSSAARHPGWTVRNPVGQVVLVGLLTGVLDPPPEGLRCRGYLVEIGTTQCLAAQVAAATTTITPATGVARRHEPRTV